MKISCIFVLICGLTFYSGEAQIHGFRQGKVYKYDVHSNAFMYPKWTTGPSDADDSSGDDRYSVEYVLKVAAVGANKMVIQPQDFRVFQEDPIREVPMSPSIREYFEAPLEVTLDSAGQPVSMKLQRSMPEIALNMKKAQVSTFILNTGSTLRPTTTNIGNDVSQLQYSSQEKSTFGQCEAKYTVQEGISLEAEDPVSRGQPDNMRKRRPEANPRPRRSAQPLQSESSEEPKSSEENKVDTSKKPIDKYDSNEDEDSSEEEHLNSQKRDSDEDNEESEHFEELRALCGAGSKMYLFKKAVDLRYCQNSKNQSTGSTQPQNAVSGSQYVTCGPNRKFVIFLKISESLVESDGKYVKKSILVDISPADSKNQLPTFPATSVEIRDFTYKTPPADFNLRNFLESNIQPQQASWFPNWFPKRNTDDRIEPYRRCLETNGLMPHKLVVRDHNSDYYNHLNLQWNLRKEQVFPVAYLLPTTAQDVATGVKCGLQSKINLVPNSGGHSYEAIGWGTNQTLVVDFRNMKNISIERSGANAIGRLEPGAMVGPVNAYFWENGGYAMPMGNCMTVGMGGHAIGGGVGYFATQYGLAVDNVIQFEIVDGRGQIVVATERENPDLFWALKGHGPGYIGIVTSFKVKLFEASNLKITLVRLRYQVKQFAKTYIAFQNMLKWIKANEPTAFIGFMMSSDTYNATLPPVSPGIEFSALHIEDPKVQPKDNKEFLENLYKIFPQPAEAILSFPNYIQFVVMTGYAPIILPHATTGKLMEIGKPDTPEIYVNNHETRFMDLPPDDQLLIFLNSMRKDLAAPRYFKAKSHFVKRNNFTEAQMEKVGEVLKRMPQNNIWILCNSEQGAIQRFGRTDMSYVHRNSVVDISVHYEGSPDPKQVEEGMSFLYELWDAIKFMDGGETYQNYPDLDIKDHLTRNYRENLPRLIQQKKKWDPTNYFVTQLSLPIIQPR